MKENQNFLISGKNRSTLSAKLTGTLRPYLMTGVLIMPQQLHTCVVAQCHITVRGELAAKLSVVS